MAESFKVLSKIRSEEHLEHITILMAVYRPNRSWLKEQLESLEKQSYADISLCIADDCPEEPVGEAFFEENLRRIPFIYEVHLQNIGTSQTYAALAKKVTDGYIAFCDQDDRWHPEKLKVLSEQMDSSDVQAAYCGLSVIDETGNVLDRDIRNIRKGDYFLYGEKIAPALLVKNCIYGCSLLIRAKIVQDALPIPQGMTFDHWFSLWAAIYGRIAFLDKPYIEYRIHGMNQSKPMRGIDNKKDYIVQRIDRLEIQAMNCKSRFELLPQSKTRNILLQKEKEVLAWTDARRRWVNHDISAFPAFCQGRKLSPRAFAFECVLPFLPQSIFQKIVKNA